MYALHMVYPTSQSLKLNVCIGINCMKGDRRGDRNLSLSYDHEMVRNSHTFVLLKHNYIICMFIFNLYHLEINIYLARSFES